MVYKDLPIINSQPDFEKIKETIQDDALFKFADGDSSLSKPNIESYETSNEETSYMLSNKFSNPNVNFDTSEFNQTPKLGKTKAKKKSEKNHKSSICFLLLKKWI